MAETQTQNQEREMTTLEIVVVIISFLGFVGTIVNVAFAVRDHITLNRLQRQVMRPPVL